MEYHGREAAGKKQDERNSMEGAEGKKLKGRSSREETGGKTQLEVCGNTADSSVSERKATAEAAESKTAESKREKARRNEKRWKRYISKTESVLWAE